MKLLMWAGDLHYVVFYLIVALSSFDDVQNCIDVNYFSLKLLNAINSINLPDSEQHLSVVISIVDYLHY